MKKAPCARFGMRIKPKMSEKPEERRNSKPPKATLFRVWMIQNCHCIFLRHFPRRQDVLPPRRSLRPAAMAGAQRIGLLLEILRRRIVAPVDRVLQELVLVVGPELANVRIGLDDGVDVLAVLLLDL